MFKKVAFTMLPVTDFKRARSFYEDTLGLKRGSASQDGVWTEYDLPGGGCLALFGGPQAKPAQGAGTSIALEVEDLDAANAKLKAAGVKYAADLVTSQVCRMSIISDSEGNPVILHQLNKK
jgi:predicted enzyme related to lactoylglutathione lyase